MFVELLRGRRRIVGPLEFAVRERPPSRAAAEIAVDAAAGPAGEAFGEPSALVLRMPAPDGARVGIVVGRKNLSRAVDRNALKRIVREAFRSQRAQLPSRDLLFRLRQRLKGVPRDVWKADVMKAVNELLVQAAQALSSTRPTRPARSLAPKSAPAPAVPDSAK